MISVKKRTCEQVMRLLMFELSAAGHKHKDIAEMLGVSVSAVKKYSLGEQTPKLESFLHLIREVHPRETLEKIAAIGGGLYIPLPAYEGETAAIMSCMSDLGREFSDVVDHVSKAVHPDSDGGTNVSRKEATELLREIEDVLEKTLLMKQIVEEAKKS
ncbi:helix-turn-helix domain-containing protein [Limisalsivibrio acetivorans]|uniref:helix-turn-helix domain-containing protein n=1 Tax=Limisalsivibrio acetivorans TaxID=1304888 RepID=UPI0003B3ECCC|nr:helix-turn-helix domain-containing protein [Limisalsivibrio acetivorans]